MQFGISTHLYHGARLDRDHLVEIAAHGFEAVEIFATRTHFDYHDERAVAAIGEHLADARLRPHSVHAPTSEGFTDGVWGPGVLDRARRRSQQASCGRRDAGGDHERHIDSARAWWSCTRGFRPPRAPEPRDNRRDAFVASVEELQQAAQPLGVRLALEVIPNPIGDAETLVGLLEGELETRRPGHLPRHRACAHARRRDRGGGDGLGATRDDAPARQRWAPRRSPRAVRRAPSTGRP